MRIKNACKKSISCLLVMAMIVSMFANFNPVFAATSVTLTANAGAKHYDADSDGVGALSNYVELSWTEDSTATSYEIYRKSSGEESYTQVATGAAIETSYIDYDVEPSADGTEYSYYIKSVDGEGNADSNEVTAKVYTAYGFDFGKAGCADGYNEVRATTKYLENDSLTYGIVPVTKDGTVTEDSWSGTDNVRDWLRIQDFSFIAEVPNGTYNVWIQTGNLNDTDKGYYWVNGVQSSRVSGKDVQTNIADVVVDDGIVELTFQLDGGRGRINAVIFTPVELAGDDTVGVCAPYYTTVTADDTGVTLSWTAPKYADGYKVYRKLSSEDAYEMISGENVITSTTYTDVIANLAYSTEYDYAVTALRGSIESDKAEVSVTTEADPNAEAVIEPVWAFDFGSTAEGDYTQVIASTLYDSTKGYGFESADNIKAAGTNCTGDLISDAVRVAPGATAKFIVDVEPGIYDIEYGTGNTKDGIKSTFVFKDGVGNELCESQYYSGKEFKYGEETGLIIADGKLVVEITAGSDKVAPITHLIITPQPMPEYKYDFGSTEEAGYIQIVASTIYDSNVGYGFVNSDNIKNAGTNCTGDLISDAVRVAPGATTKFIMDVVAGVYDINYGTGNTKDGIKATFAFTDGSENPLCESKYYSGKEFQYGEENGLEVKDGKLIMMITAGSDKVAPISYIELVCTEYIFATQLEAPTTTATVNGANVDVSWNAVTADETTTVSYKLERSSDGVNWTELGTGLTATSYTDAVAGLDFGTTYTYKVTAVPSTEDYIANTSTAEAALPAFTTTVAGDEENKKVNISWTGYTGATAYNFYRNDTLIAENTTETSYVDDMLLLETSTLYTYSVELVFGSDKSAKKYSGTYTTPAVIKPEGSINENITKPTGVKVTMILGAHDFPLDEVIVREHIHLQDLISLCIR